LITFNLVQADSPPSANNVHQDSVNQLAPTTSTGALNEDHTAPRGVTSAARPVAAKQAEPAVVYLYRPSKLAGMAIHYYFFVNGNYITSLSNSSYVRLEVPSGMTVISGTTADFAYRDSTPPAPVNAAGTGCESINWRRIGDVPQGVVARCESDLKAAEAALREGTVLPADLPHDKVADLIASYYAKLASDERLNICKIHANCEALQTNETPGVHPELSSGEHTRVFVPAACSIRSNCLAGLQIASMALHPPGQSTSFSAEPGATYYVKFIPGFGEKIVQVDMATGAKEVSHLRLSNDPQFPVAYEKAPPTPQLGSQPPP
jgi:hypothetical protein